MTLPEMIGDDLARWIFDEHSEGRLTLPRLRAKLDEHADFLEKRGIVAGYAYYAVQHVFNQLGHPIPEK